MSKANKTSQWIMTFNYETRELTLCCSKCKSLFRYNIVKVPDVCPCCGEKMHGIKYKE